MTPCLAPLILIGQLLTLYPNASHTTNIDGQAFEVQSCVVGPGIHAGATTAGMAFAGVHFGVGTTIGPDTRVTIQPFVGASHMANVRELPSELQFEVGGQVIVMYGKYGIAGKYFHASNAGMKAPNIGKDAIVLSVVYQF